MHLSKTTFGLLWALGLLSLSAAQAQDAASTKSSTASPYKGEFVLVHNKDPVCVNFNRNLNQFRHIDFDVCHPRLSPKFPEFSRPTWREVPLDLELAAKMLSGYNGPSSISRQSGDYWKKWLSETEALRQQGHIKMWLTDVDVNHDGETDTIARVDRAASGRAEPFAKRDCPYTSSGLWLLAEPKEELWGNAKHFVFSSRTDLIHSSATQRTYAIEWAELAMSDYDFPSPLGATRGVAVGLARDEKTSYPIEVCFMAWVPTGVSTRLTPQQRWKRPR